MTILLSGGPEDGKTATIEESYTIYHIFKTLPPNPKDGIQIGVRKGVYKRDGERLGVQVFKWVGWEE